MSVGFCITFIGLLTRRYIEQTPPQTVPLMSLLDREQLTCVAANSSRHLLFYFTIHKVKSYGYPSPSPIFR
jgi:hypothetical protein